MKIESPAFAEKETIPKKYTCDGDNINPLLKISGVPANAKSMALIVDDPDATRGVTWVHWIILNINPAVREIAENSLPEKATELFTSFDKPGYGGPCPPPGSKPHRYFFKLYALDSEINSTEEIDGHTIEKAELMGFYSR
ncbi:MAG: YbhB/YbcL family Raf kinase inhibitor-like protein [bacterium]|nr:YbhB/YbcL family Raf kinase inhibitor-like protein [bacterium]